MSTLISDLEGTPSGGDGDFVQNILNEMNGGGGGMGPRQPSTGMIQPPPGIGGINQGTVIVSQMPSNAVAQRVMDTNPATAHMIGGSQPTPADFAQIMGGAGPSGGAVPIAAGGGGVADAAASYQAGPAVRPYIPTTKKSWLTRILDDFRPALFVAILVFVFSLPVVNFLFAHYLPSMVKSSGELTTIGLIIKSLAAGAAFWTLQRVIVPLLSL